MYRGLSRWQSIQTSQIPADPRLFLAYQRGVFDGVHSGGGVHALAASLEASKMKRAKRTLNGLLGAIVLSAGFAVSTPAIAGSGDGEETVDVRIKMADGTVVIQKARRRSARVDSGVLGTAKARRLPDGSRVSIGAGAGSSQSTSGARSATRQSGQAEQGTAARRGGVVSTSKQQDTQDAGAQGIDRGMDASGANGAVENSASEQDTPNVPTAGNPQYSSDGAFGGQTVSFKDLNMYATVIGDTIYLVGVEIAQADQSFDVVRGTRLLADTAILDETVLVSRSAEDRHEGRAQLKLQFEPGTVVNLVMYSQSGDADSWSGKGLSETREKRTWTVRIR